MPRKWGKNIVIDGSWYTDTKEGRQAEDPRPEDLPAGRSAVPDRADSYERAVQDILRTIEYGGPRQPYTRVGNLLMRWIARQAPGRLLWIAPVAYGDYDNTKTLGIGPDGAIRRDRDGDGDLDVGGGCSCVIKFEPATWEGRDTRDGYDDQDDMDPEDVLVHELFHALRAMLGVQTPNEMPWQDAEYDDLEEFFAVIIENIYRSETGRTKGLRADHAMKFRRLSAKWGVPEVTAGRDSDFYGLYEGYIDDLCRTPGMEGFFVELGFPTYPPHVWNPVRARMDKVFNRPTLPRP